MDTSVYSRSRFSALPQGLGEPFRSLGLRPRVQAHHPGAWQGGARLRQVAKASPPMPLPQRLSSSPGPHQHVLCQPALIPGQAGGDAQGKALLAQQGVPTIAAAEGDDLPPVWHVANQGFFRIAWPPAHRIPWRQWGHSAAGTGIRNQGVRDWRDQGLTQESLGSNGTSRGS